MFTARPITRSAAPKAARALRSTRARQTRFQSTSTSSTTQNASSSSSHIASGVAGGLAGAGLLYGIFSMTPTGKAASKINKAARETQKTYQEAAKKLEETTPTADQAINYIKEFCYTYVAWVPGGRAYVDAAFKDIDTLRENHGEDVEKIVNDAYRRLQAISKSSGLSFESASKVYDVLADVGKQFASLAGDAIGELLDNHPQIKEKVGPGIDQLKQMGEDYGPEAKKAVDDTWKQVKDIAAGGLTLETANKVRKLVEEKKEQVKKLGDEAWQKGLEQAKPYLDKNPKIKELLEKNGDALKQGNYSELFQQVKEAANSGSVDKLEEFVNKATETAKSKGSDLLGSSSSTLDQFFKMIPEGSEFMPKIQQLSKVFKEHSKEGEQLLKETAEDLKKVLEEKVKKAEQIAEKAKKDAK